MSSVYRVGNNAHPSDIDGAPGWYWTDAEGDTHGPYRDEEVARESEHAYMDEKIENNFVKRNA